MQKCEVKQYIDVLSREKSGKHRVVSVIDLRHIGPA